MNEDRIRDATTRASQAYDLLNNEMLREAFDTLQSEYMKFWAHTKPLETTEREAIFVAWHVVEKVQDHLRRLIENGKIAQFELEDLIKKQELLKRIVI